MSIRSFVNNGMHFGKLGERRSDTYGTIEIFDIGEVDSVGAYYSGDKSLQAHPLSWYDELTEALTKAAKKRNEEQKIVMPARPTLGRKPSLASELRRLSHIDTPWVKPVVAAKAESGSGKAGDVTTGGGKKARTAKAPRKPRAVETVEIPKGADKQLKAWLEAHGACKAIRLLVHANLSMNKTSVIELAKQIGINKTTAGVQFVNAKRDVAAGKAEPAATAKKGPQKGPQLTTAGKALVKEAVRQGKEQIAKKSLPAVKAKKGDDPLGLMAGLRAIQKTAPKVKAKGKAKGKKKAK